MDAGHENRMGFAELRELIEHRENAVILVEGIRALPTTDRPAVVAMGERLARAFPKAIFRTGNAEGTDEAFAEGIAGVAPERLQYILPYSGHRMKNIKEKTSRFALSEISGVAETQAVYETKKSSPAYTQMMEKREEVPVLRAKARYILRDTIKVIGDPQSGLLPADVGIFYANPEDPMKGGTGHTIRVCKSQGIPVIDQMEWGKWE